MKQATPGRLYSQAVRLGRWTLTTAVGVVVLLIFVAVAPILAGRRTFIVMGGSMEPSIPLGSAVVTEQVRPSQLQAGDVITFVPPLERVVTHRIVRVEQDQLGLAFYTQGDANDSPDPIEVRPVNVLGRVWYHVPFAGYLLHYANQTATKLALMVLAVVIVGSQLQQWAYNRSHRPLPPPPRVPPGEAPQEAGEDPPSASSRRAQSRGS